MTPMVTSIGLLLSLFALAHSGYQGPGPWGPWGPCTGYGYQKNQVRTRPCSGYSCGPKEEKRPCQEAKWADWGPWTPCSTSCGPGTTGRTRTCTSYGGAQCDGPAKEDGPCTNYKPCPEWTPWLPWTPCSTSCGPGQQTRSRSCQNGQSGMDCPGSDSDQQPCANYKPCPEWTPWTPWQPCSTTCGPGDQLRSRDCQNGQSGTDCPGLDKENQPCSGYQPCCSWGDWNSYATCSVTCGAGVHERTRICKGGSYGGGPGCQCEGDGKMSEPCNGPPCSSYYKPGG